MQSVLGSIQKRTFSFSTPGLELFVFQSKFDPRPGSVVVISGEKGPAPSGRLKCSAVVLAFLNLLLQYLEIRSFNYCKKGNYSVTSRNAIPRNFIRVWFKAQVTPSIRLHPTFPGDHIHQSRADWLVQLVVLLA